jgi:hypothetical protein
MPSGRAEPVSTSATGCISSASRFLPFQWPSLTTISWTPASSAPSMAALHSSVISRRDISYSRAPGRTWSQSVIPATPSMSAEMKTRIQSV